MKTKEKKGITLIAMVVTIIILLILAGVSLNLVLGENGIITRAKTTGKIQTIATIKEALELEKVDIQVENRKVDLDSYLDQISKGKKRYDLSSKEKIDDKTAEIIINDEHKFLVKDKENGDVEITYEGIAKGDDLALSKYNGTYIYPESGTFTVTNNASGGELTVNSDAPNIVTASIDENVVTVMPGTIAGKANIIVKSSANGEYAENKVIHVATVENGTISLSVTPYEGTYDGQAHNAITQVDVNPSDAKLEYSLDGNTYSETMPTITNTSEFTVTVKASKAGYKTQTTTETVKVNKANGNLILSATSGTIAYPNNTSFTVSNNTGSLSVSSSNSNIASASISGNTVTVKSGTTAGKATITVTSAEASNYNAKSATYIATVQNGTISLSATPYSGTYDGRAHNAITNVTVNPSDAKLEYSTNGTNYSTTMPTITNTSSFTVTVKASKAGYKTQTTTETVKVNKANGNLTLSATSGTITYPTTSTTFTVSGNTGKLSVSSSNTNVATASISGNTVTVKAGSSGGTATITVTSAEASNYNAKTAIYTARIRKIEDLLKIGNYVNYKYDTASAYNLQSKYSGYSSDQSISQKKGLKWRILNIEKTTGTIDLISEKSIETDVKLGGILGYNNGPYLLNEICKAQYSNKSLGTSAKSINLLDFEKHLTTKGINARNSFVNIHQGVQYGKTMRYTGESAYYPALYKNQKGAGINTTSVSQPNITRGNDPYNESQNIATREPTTDSSKIKATSVLTVTQTNYEININSDNYGEAASVLGDGSWYWVASRCVDIQSNTATFGIRYAYKNLYTRELMYSFDYYNNGMAGYLRPIVSLKSSTFTGTKDSSGAWNLK